MLFMKGIKIIVQHIAIKIIVWLDISTFIGSSIRSSFLNYHSSVTYRNSFFYYDSEIKNMQNNPANIIVGNGTHIRGELLLFAYGGEIKIGNDCYIGDHTRIWSGEKIIIGNDVLISHNVSIADTNAHEIDAEERAEGFRNIFNSGFPKVKGNIKTTPIYIGDHAWINFNAIILKGVTIGEGAIVAAGSVVTKNVAPYTLVAGNPATVKKYLKSDS